MGRNLTFAIFLIATSNQKAAVLAAFFTRAIIPD